MDTKLIRVSANIPEDSPLYRALENEQRMTGRNASDIVRDALVNRYGIKVGGNGNREAK